MNILNAEEKRARKAEARRQLAEAILTGAAIPAAQRQAIEDAAAWSAAVAAEDALDDALSTDAIFEEMCFVEYDWAFEKDDDRRLAGMRKSAATLRRLLLASADVRV